MDKKLMQSYLDNIAELVVDEDKIVTYKSLSKSLGIHVNTAKQLLYVYLSKDKSKNSFPISATYLLAGKVKDGSFNISIVNEVDLKSIQSKFVEITSEHVYSIQKGKHLRELKVLCGTDEDSANISSPLVIKCSKSILKSRLEVKKKPDFWKDETKKVIENALTSGKEAVNFAEANNKIESSISKESQTKSPVKRSPTKKSPKGNSEKPQAEIKKHATESIANLFAKAAQKNADKPVKDNSGLKNKQGDIEPASIPANTAADVRENLNTQRRNVEEGSQSKEISKKKKSGSKRKRIQMLSDSEDSESSNEKGTEEASPVEEDSPLLHSALEGDKEEINDCIPQNKRKKRKVIDRTVMNEDGYLETKKEVVFETDSENEVDEERKTDVEKKAKVVRMNEQLKGVQNASTAKKQSSLLSFFKKS